MSNSTVPQHIGIIMDGNGRWAKKRGLPRTAGHAAGSENFRKIAEQSKGKCNQFALGGRGDPDQHEHFEEILKLSNEYGIVPNFTTSGIMMTEWKAKLCKKYCGAVAVSEHFADYTQKAIDMLLSAGVKTNIHFVLSKNSIDYAIDKLLAPFKQILGMFDVYLPETRGGMTASRMIFI